MKRANLPTMTEKHEITEVASKATCCIGDGDRPHRPVDLILSPSGVVTCPICGRRFRRAESSEKFDPAVWPKGD